MFRVEGGSFQWLCGDVADIIVTGSLWNYNNPGSEHWKFSKVFLQKKIYETEKWWF